MLHCRGAAALLRGVVTRARLFALAPTCAPTRPAHLQHRAALRALHQAQRAAGGGQLRRPPHPAPAALLRRAGGGPHCAGRLPHPLPARRVCGALQAPAAGAGARCASGGRCCLQLGGKGEGRQVGAEEQLGAKCGAHHVHNRQQMPRACPLRPCQRCICSFVPRSQDRCRRASACWTCAARFWRTLAWTSRSTRSGAPGGRLRDQAAWQCSAEAACHAWQACVCAQGMGC